MAGTTCVGNTDMQMNRWRDLEECVSDNLLLFHALHNPTLSCYRVIFLGNVKQIKTHYLWHKCHCFLPYISRSLVLTCLSGLLITQINCLHFVSPGLFCSSLLLDNYMPKKVNMPPDCDDFSGT